MELAHALLRSGVVTEDDVERVKVQEEIDREVERVVRVVELRYGAALKRIHGIRFGLGSEINAWMESTEKLVPIEVVEAWAELDGENQLIEWARWLAAYRAHQEAPVEN